MSSERRILVTGGAGFIGSAVVRLLIERGWRVATLDKLTYAGTTESLRDVMESPNHQFFKADIADTAAIQSILAKVQPAAIMHLAAESHVDRSIDGPGEFIQTNVVGTYRLLEAALDHWRRLEGAAHDDFRFHHVSTDEVYGSLGLDEDERFTESTAYDPSSPYAATKAASDHLARVWHRTFGLPVVLSNCSNNYGPYQFPEKLIPLTILNAIEGKPLPVYGKGENVRDWLYVEDHAAALEAILTRGRPGDTYNVGGGEERSNLAVVREICGLVDERSAGLATGPRESLIQFVADRPGHDLRYAIDSSRLREELGWQPSQTFSNGLARTVDWYIANRWWWEPLRERRYRGQRLGTAQ